MGDLEGVVFPRVQHEQVEDDTEFVHVGEQLRASAVCGGPLGIRGQIGLGAPVITFDQLWSASVFSAPICSSMASSAATLRLRTIVLVSRVFWVSM